MSTALTPEETVSSEVEAKNEKQKINIKWILATVGVIIFILAILFGAPLSSQGTDKVMNEEISLPENDWQEVDTITNKVGVFGERTADTTRIWSSDSIQTSPEQFGTLINELANTQSDPEGEPVMYYCDNNATSCSGEFPIVFAGSLGEHKVTVSQYVGNMANAIVPNNPDDSVILAITVHKIN